MIDIAHRLKEVRKRKGLSQSQMASSLGVSLRSYQDYEKGTRPPTADKLKPVAELGVNIHWLITGKGEMFLNDNEQQQLQAEYWQTNHRRIETALKLAYQRLANSDGEDRAREIFAETTGITRLE